MAVSSCRISLCPSLSALEGRDHRPADSALRAWVPLRLPQGHYLAFKSSRVITVDHSRRQSLAAVLSPSSVPLSVIRTGPGPFNAASYLLAESRRSTGATMSCSLLNSECPCSLHALQAL